MKSFWQPRKIRAFTLIELLVVIAIIGILAALLLPTMVRAKQRALRIECVSDLKQVGTAFQIFAHDHQSKFPMQVPGEDGGSLEYATAAQTMGGDGFFFSWRQFQPLANDLVTPKPLVCPTDLARESAASFKVFQNSNLSFAVGVTADYNEPSSVLAADRNLTNNGDRLPSSVMANHEITWTRELHFFKGNTLFADTHVEELNTIHLALPKNTVLFLPTVPPAFPTGTQPPAMAASGQPPSPTSSSTAGPAAVSGPAGVSHQQTAAVANSLQPKPSSPQTPASLGTATSAASASKESDLSEPPPFVENDAKENERGTATNHVANPLAAPPVEDYQLPLARLLGAAKSDGAGSSHWWLWLLLALLLAIAAYVYSRWKKYIESDNREDYDEV